MKIRGPTDAGPPQPTERAESAPPEPSEIRATDDVAATVDLQAVVADLQAGRVTPAEAVETLIRRAVEKVSAAERAEVALRIREALSSLAASDPGLQAKIDRLRQK